MNDDVLAIQPDHDVDDPTIHGLICELGYQPSDVCAVRLCESAIEIDFIDFVDDDWPLIARRHAIPVPRRRPLRSAHPACD